jgi:circadian clock protein KaiB
MNEYFFKLFVTGKTIRSENAIKTIKEFCKEFLDDQCKVEIIDVLEQPDLAEEEKILATPTLVRQIPPPELRLVGDINDIKLLRKHIRI